MLSKEETEKAKERIKYICDKSLNNISYNHILTTLELHYLRLLLQYIDQLEQEKNKQSKIIDEMAKSIYLEMSIEFYNEKGIKEQTITGIKQYFKKKVEE